MVRAISPQLVCDWCVGQRLDEINRQSTRASESKQLIEYFIQFQNGEQPAIFGDATQIHEAAQLILRLSAFAQEMALDSGRDASVAAAVDAIERLTGTIEGNLMELFSQAARVSDHAAMRVRCSVF